MQTLLIVGGTGSLGRSLINRLKNVYKIIIYSRDENKQWELKRLFPFLTLILGDVRDKEHFERILLRYKPNKIIIAAALKHIDVCELNIDECIRTNITGIQNVLNAVTENSMRNLLPNLDTVVFISTDKATSPVNVYGMCKSICERMMAEKSFYLTSPKFVTVRYGNVLQSRGSLIPLFHEIGKDSTKTHFPITHEDMTRFFMRLDDSIDLILNAIENGVSGDTFIPRIESYKILDIAKAFSELYNKPIKIVGIRPGEKMHECLINESERHRTVQQGNVYIIKPCYANFDSVVDFENEYTSATYLCTDSNKIKSVFGLN